MKESKLGGAKGIDEQEIITADATVGASLISWDLFHLLERFEPFGEGNKQPSFVVRNVPLLEARPVGKTAKHIRLRLRMGDDVMSGIGFDLAEKAKDLGQAVDIVGQVDMNEFRGKLELQLRVQDVATAGSVNITEV